MATHFNATPEPNPKPNFGLGPRPQNGERIVKQDIPNRRRSAGSSADLDGTDAPVSAALAQNSLVVKTLATLIAEHGAQSISHWNRASQFAKNPGALELTSTTQEMSVEIEAKARELADRCLNSKEVESQICSSRIRSFIVAAPVPEIANYAITVVFPLNRLSDQKGGYEQMVNIHMRCRDVALTASHLSVVKHKSAVELHKQHQRDLSENERELSWREFRDFSVNQIKAACQQGLGNFKLLAAIAAGLIVLLLLPWPHAVICDAKCEPAVQRFVAAPFSGKLLESKVVPGDTVKENQILAFMDGSDVRSEIAGLRAQLAQASQRYAKALSSSDAASAELERLEVSQLKSKIEILAAREQRLEIRSPIDGVVVSGNLERAKGAALELGENLFEIAPLSEMVAEIAVPETEISYISVGMKARLTLDAKAGKSQSTKIERIHPRNEMLDGKSVFIAEANLQSTGDSIKPGMSGSVRIRTGLKPIGWVLFHRPYEALRATLGW